MARATPAAVNSAGASPAGALTPEGMEPIAAPAPAVAAAAGEEGQDVADDEMPACAVPPAAGSAAKEEQAVGAVAPAAAGGAARAAEQKTRGRKRPSQEPVPTRPPGGPGGVPDRCT